GWQSSPGLRSPSWSSRSTCSAIRSATCSTRASEGGADPPPRTPSGSATSALACMHEGTSMTYETLLLDRAGTDGRVARITLNRPEKLNALSQELLFELEDALKDLETDESARAIILRGAGRAFSAGY